MPAKGCYAWTWWKPFRTSLCHLLLLPIKNDQETRFPMATDFFIAFQCHLKSSLLLWALLGSARMTWIGCILPKPPPSGERYLFGDGILSSLKASASSKDYVVYVYVRILGFWYYIMKYSKPPETPNVHSFTLSLTSRKLPQNPTKTRAPQTGFASKSKPFSNVVLSCFIFPNFYIFHQTRGYVTSYPRPQNTPKQSSCTMRAGVVKPFTLITRSPG